LKAEMRLVFVCGFCNKPINKPGPCVSHERFCQCKHCSHGSAYGCKHENKHWEAEHDVDDGYQWWGKRTLPCPDFEGRVKTKQKEVQS
jgi:hypothetical protein